MRRLLTPFLLCGLLSMVYGLALAETADEAYKSARECYIVLKADASAQKLREPWDNCIRKFEEVAKRYRRQPQGADAKYSIGRLYEELASNSKNRLDWAKAVKEYESFGREYSRNSKADDAYYRAACIHWERLGDKSAAKKDLLKVIKFYKNGDRVREASKYLEAVEAGLIPEETAKGASGDVSKGGSAVPPFTVVIDPGHGGSDAGAIGHSGTKEKDITLAISKKLASALKKKFSGAKVYLTREGDKTLTLDDRVRFANKKEADFFISVHANASTSKKERGVQTYYLNNATDEAAKRLAAQENKNAGRKSTDLEKIIATMLQNAATDESREFARVVQQSIVRSVSKKYSKVEDDKVGSALFYVLVGVKCPSILVETSYISNPMEEKRLGDPAYQEAIAGSIAAGVGQYLKSRKEKISNL